METTIDLGVGVSINKEQTRIGWGMILLSCVELLVGEGRAQALHDGS